MFPNNPLFLEKLTQTTQEEILREIQDVNEYEFPHFRAFYLKSNVNFKILILVGMLVALAWLLNVVV